MKLVETLKQAVGSLIHNKDGETIGRITEITQNINEELQYILLSDPTILAVAHPDILPFRQPQSL